MKSLKKIIASNKFSLFLRKFLDIKSPKLLVPAFSNNVSISDAFFWRTDNEFETVFRYTDLLKFFYGEKSSFVRVVFYDSSNKFIKELKINIKNSSGEVLINKKLLNNIEGYGSFFIFHETKKKQSSNIQKKVIIRNSCYTGYSKNNQNPSFVHGNIPTIGKDIIGSHYYFNFSQWNGFKNNTYILQNNFKSFDKSELCFINPMSKSLSLNVNDTKYLIKKHNSIIVPIKNVTLCKIQSNCSFIRPIIFNYNKQFYDVYHG